jgi:lambda repressor-like predicted transcriptional regulator
MCRRCRYERLYRGHWPSSMRVPLGPVEALFAGDPKVQWQSTGSARLAADSTIAEACGVDRRTVLRWRRAGILPSRACEIADRLGVHPEVLWPGIYDPLVTGDLPETRR